MAGRKLCGYDGRDWVMVLRAKEHERLLASHQQLGAGGLDHGPSRNPPCPHSPLGPTACRAMGE